MQVYKCSNTAAVCIRLTFSLKSFISYNKKGFALPWGLWSWVLWRGCHHHLKSAIFLWIICSSSEQSLHLTWTILTLLSGDDVIHPHYIQFLHRFIKFTVSSIIHWITLFLVPQRTLAHKNESKKRALVSDQYLVDPELRTKCPFIYNSPDLNLYSYTCKIVSNLLVPTLDLFQTSRTLSWQPSFLEPLD